MLSVLVVDFSTLLKETSYHLYAIQKTKKEETFYKFFYVVSIILT